MAHDEQAPDTEAAIEATVRAALEGLPDGLDAPLHRHWLGVGLRLGLERPDRARHLLTLLGADPGAGGGSGSPGGGADGPAAADPTAIPVRSQLLARSALLTASAEADAGPDAVFGWVTRLTADEILAMGDAVQHQLDTGAPANVARGFGLAWQEGAKIPVQRLNGMMAEFAKLEVVAGGVLAGHELVVVGTPSAGAGGSGGSGGLFGSLLGPLRRTPTPGTREADAVLRRLGRPAQLGLVALWNAWIAVRLRDRLRADTFALLVHPWVSVVGPLPERQTAAD